MHGIGQAMFHSTNFIKPENLFSLSAWFLVQHSSLANWLNQTLAGSIAGFRNETELQWYIQSGQIIQVEKEIIGNFFLWIKSDSIKERASLLLTLNCILIQQYWSSIVTSISTQIEFFRRRTRKRKLSQPQKEFATWIFQLEWSEIESGEWGNKVLLAGMPECQ